MKALYVGPYRQSDGWGEASRRYLQAFMHSEMDVSARPFYARNDIITKYDAEWLNTAEKKGISSYDVIVQHCLPYNFSRYEGHLNVGISFFETCDLNISTWIDKINLLDLLIVPSTFEKNALIKSGATTRIEVIPIPYNVDVEPTRSLYTPVHSFVGDYKFYFIGDFSKRKNIEDLIIAFYSEFIYGENVKLILKLGIDGQTKSSVIKLLDTIKQQCGLYDNPEYYRNEYIISDYLVDSEITALHNTCDCYVSSSYGESIGLPILDAMNAGKLVIVNKNSGSSQFVNDSNGLLANSYKIPAIDPNRPISELYRTSDSWYKIDVFDLRKQMRRAFEMSLRERQEKTKNARETIRSLSFDNVAQIINQVICE